MNYVISLMKDIVKKRRLIADLAKADFRKRFVGSYFGDRKSTRLNSSHA